MRIILERHFCAYSQLGPGIADAVVNVGHVTVAGAAGRRPALNQNASVRQSGRGRVVTTSYHIRALSPSLGYRIKDGAILRSVVILKSHDAADYEQAAIGHVGVTGTE